VTRYSGLPAGLDGQALMWLTLDELEKAELLPADRPIVRALRLPERLREASTDAHDLVDLAAVAAAPEGAVRDPRLHGFFCRDVEEAGIAAGRGADFVVFSRELTREALEHLCSCISIPVFAHGMPLEAAWAAGATGVSSIDS
jgi:hypothetical protein